MSTLPLKTFYLKGYIDIMRTEQYLTKELGMYFKRHKIATLNQLQSALGNPKERTVFRKLKLIAVCTTYCCG
jgi:hypothetical protein